MKSITSLALACAILIVFNFSNSQAQTTAKFYTPGQVLFSTQSGADHGVGINVPRPEARLHIFEDDDKATALRINLAQPAIVGGGIATPGFAFELNYLPYGESNVKRYLSIDPEGILRVGRNNSLYSVSDQLSVSRTFGVYRNTSEYLRLQYTFSPKFIWKSDRDFKFINEYSGTEPLTFSPDGKVGINTDHFVGSHSLYIEGSVIAEEIFVKLKADWADYVFAPDYELMPLKELEAYVNRNHRLPGMPAAEQVAEEGIELGENQRVLTEKIEELTLYLIEQQKLLAKQQAEIEKLKKQINK